MHSLRLLYLAFRGIAAMNARRAVLTDCDVEKTFETSVSSTTTVQSLPAQPANRLGRALPTPVNMVLSGVVE
jgi:hypothetical protein